MTAGKVYVILALLVLVGISQKPTSRSFYGKNCLLYTPFFLLKDRNLY
jgi:uncharacterized membrane protein